ncbi:MAG: hypothetical protein Q8P25_02535 [Candidatus Curtissbacteria bacterium]|nr:hypothetical protein [Candidatus Curtissbacteria bacterium]
MRGLSFFLILLFVTILVYLPAFSNFFAQDDFIFIRHFSQNGILVDLKNTFGIPEVTHWRPFHNLYFFLTGNLFGKNYLGYHLTTLAVHVFSSFLIFKIFQKLFKNEFSAIFASIFYAVHPAHFVALFWVSGAAVNIGFFLILIGIYSLLLNKRSLASIFYLMALLASESMLVGPLVMTAIVIYQKKFSECRFFLLVIGFISILFLILKLSYLTPKSTFETYDLEISLNVINSFRYYLLRILGLVEGFGKHEISLLLLILYGAVFFVFIRIKKTTKLFNQFSLGIFITFLGLFPFALLPEHLSAHYMTVSIWGLSILFGLSLSKSKNYIIIPLTIAFLFISYSSVRLSMTKSWVIDRSNLSKRLLESIDSRSYPAGSTIYFFDDDMISSEEKYVALGGGSALSVWYSDKQYKTCFSFFENCELK